MAKAKKVKAGGVAVYADGRILSRLQSVTADTDLGVEEIREISNLYAAEFVEGIPTVTLSLEGNLYGKRDNIVALAGAGGAKPDTTVGMWQKNLIAGGVPNISINQTSFDGTSTDIVIQMEEDGVLARSCLIQDMFLTSWGVSFDVGGVATESVSLEGDNKVWYLNAQREIIVLSGHLTAIGSVNSGMFYQSNYGTSYFGTSDFDADFEPLFITADGEKVVDDNGTVVVPVPHPNSRVALPDNGEDNWTQISGVARLRLVGYKVAPSSTITATHHTAQLTDNSSIGGVRKGMLEIYLVSGSTYDLATMTKTEYFRLQTCSIDADLSREALEELGNYKAFDRSLTFPISVTVNFSALSSDLEDWARFAGAFPPLVESTGAPTAITSIQFRDFVQTAGVLIKIFDDDESNLSREHLMTITVSGVRVASESTGFDAGGNATQDFSCSADNFVIS